MVQSCEKGFYHCIDLLVKLKDGIKYHTKVFDMGFNKGRQVAKTVDYHFDGVTGGQTRRLQTLALIQL